MSLNDDADGMANSVDPDQPAPPDLGIHCLPRSICPKTESHYSNPFTIKILSIGTNTLGKQCRSRPDCCILIRVYTVCHSVCIFWTL